MENKKFYYLRSKGNHPVVTICLIAANGDVSKGMAICSESDNPCKAIGRKIANNRAVRAMKVRGDSLQVGTENAFAVICSLKDLNFLTIPGHQRLYKSNFNPELTKFEKRILGI